MNTRKANSGNSEDVLRTAGVIHKKQNLSIKLNEKLLEFGKERSKELGYEGGFSGYVGGLILFDLIAKRPHWLTVELLNDPEQLEAAIFEIQEQPPEKWGTWVDARMREIAQREQAKSTGRTAEAQ